MVFGVKLPKESLVSLAFAMSECLLKGQGISSHISFFTVKFPMLASNKLDSMLHQFYEISQSPQHGKSLLLATPPSEPFFNVCEGSATQ